ELSKGADAECPNGSQVGLTRVTLYGFFTLTEPVYMMVPPEGSDVVARLGMVAGLFPTLIDFSVRSERQDDFGLTAEIHNASPDEEFVQADVTTWGVPADPSHDTERCTPREAFSLLCVESPKRPPGSRPLPFLT